MFFTRKKGFKKRYVISMAALILMLPLSRLEFFKFRMSDEQYREQMQKQGLAEPVCSEYVYKGKPIHYIQMGEKKGRTLLFMHGSPGSASACIDYLSSKRLLEYSQIIAVDRPGFGYSGFGEAERSLAAQSMAMKPLVEQKKREGQVILIGHSYGGPLIARMAMDYPELIDGLVMVAPSIDPELEPKEWWRKPLNWLSPIMPPAFIVSNQEIMALEAELREMLPFWDRITMPVMVLQGGKDRLVPAENADFAKKMLAHNPRLEVRLLPEGRHFVFWTKQKWIENAILDVVKGEG
jgi:pimeloyl-ACP methyl ester carboxylesterase